VTSNRFAASLCILRGEKPADLPIMQPGKWKFREHILLQLLTAGFGTWLSSSATQQGPSVVEGAADQKTAADAGRHDHLPVPRRAGQDLAGAVAEHLARGGRCRRVTRGGRNARLGAAGCAVSGW